MRLDHLLFSAQLAPLLIDVGVDRHGDVPLPDTLPAVQQTDARHFFVEQDFSPDRLASFRHS